MFNPLLEIYATTFQRDREKEILRLYEEAKLLREAKAVNTSKPNLIEQLSTSIKAKMHQRTVPAPLRTSMDCCSASKVVQCETC